MHGNGMCSSVLDYGTGKGMLVDRLRAQLPDTIDIEMVSILQFQSGQINPILLLISCFAWMFLNMLRGSQLMM